MPRIIHKAAWGMLFLVFSIQFSFSQEQQYQFRHITTAQGLSTNTVYVVMKDSLGFMWFSTSMGLCRYDGYNIKVFTSDPNDSTSLSGNYLYAEPFEDKDGFLWIGTHDNGVSRFNKTNERFTHFKHDPNDPGTIDNNSIWTIYQDRSGVIWIGTHTALNKFNNESHTFQAWSPNPENPEDPANLIYSLLDDSNNNLWVTTGRGIMIFDRDKEEFRRFEPSSSMADSIRTQLVF